MHIQVGRWRVRPHQEGRCYSIEKQSDGEKKSWKVQSYQVGVGDAIKRLMELAEMGDDEYHSLESLRTLWAERVSITVSDVDEKVAGTS